VLQVAAAGGDARLYDAYLARMKASADAPEEYYRFFNALAAFRDPALVSRTLRFALSTDARSQDTPLLLSQMLGGSATQEAAWTFVQREWTALTDKLGTFQGVPNVVGGLGAFCSSSRADEIKAFFEAHPVPETARVLQQSLERIQTCAAVSARQSPALGRWLDTHASSAAAPHPNGH